MKRLFLYALGAFVLTAALWLLGYAPDGMGWQIAWPFLTLGLSVFLETTNEPLQGVKCMLVASGSMSVFLLLVAATDALGIGDAGGPGGLGLVATPLMGVGQYYNTKALFARQERKAAAEKAANVAAENAE